MPSIFTPGRTLLVVLGSAALAGACGTAADNSTFVDNSGDDGGADGSVNPEDNGDSGLQPNFGDTGSTTNTLAIVISPPNPVIDVTVTNDVVTAPALTVLARDTATSVPVAASWELDRGEIAAINASTGIISATGHVAGTAKLTARYQNLVATTNVTVRIKSVNVGANAGSGTGPQAPDAMGQLPAGGYNGVGGSVLGGTPPPAVQTLLGTGTGTSAGFTWLYPYTNTVWPRGMLAPLIQWTAPAAFSVTGFYVHLKQANFEFEGYYAGTGLTSQPIDAKIWKQLTSSNSGDPLHVEIKITDGTTVYGPLAQDWIVAPGPLKGTVYYNTYNTKLNGPVQNGSDGNGAVLAIKPGASAPALAVPANYGKCTVCHEVSSNGSTLYTNDTSLGDYGYGASYDLTKSPAVMLKKYDATTGLPNAEVIGKYTYSAVYPDGTFALASSREDYHAYANDSDIFARDSLLPIASTGFKPFVSRAVTPAFSPDGKRIAFNFWAGAGTNGVVAGNGRTLAGMDFSCNSASPGGACGAPPYAFSNMRTLYTDPNAAHYVGWPSFTPDGLSVIFQRTTAASTDNGSPLNTRSGAQAELWIASTTGAYPAMPLCALNGMNPTCTQRYLPDNGSHAADPSANFEPTVTPIASGGYYWVLFTTRRMYGNVAAGDPYYPRQGEVTDPTKAPTKKLWVAAFDIHPKPGVDPSHPAFYLPGQELTAGNMRGFWVNDPCHADGATCDTGDECCNGYCRESAGKLSCGGKPQGCAQEFDKCSVDADCCGAGATISCIGGRCSRNSPK